MRAAGQLPNTVTTIYTIGHSTRTLEAFLALLERERIQRIADVRRFPFSRRHPQFNGDVLKRSLAERGIAYVHLDAMGGRRDAPKSLPPTGWRESSFNAYAHHMTTPAFRAARDSLLADSDRTRTAIMCAEAVPWRCHRNLISDSVVALGWQVQHILDAGTKPHELTDFAAVVNGEVEYAEPLQEQQSLF
jgi:uncharacterized protein (DUF488 family)